MSLVYFVAVLKYLLNKEHFQATIGLLLSERVYLKCTDARYYSTRKKSVQIISDRCTQYRHVLTWWQAGKDFSWREFQVLSEYPSREVDRAVNINNKQWTHGTTTVWKQLQDSNGNHSDIWLTSNACIIAHGFQDWGWDTLQVQTELCSSDWTVSH